VDCTLIREQANCESCANHKSQTTNPKQAPNPNQEIKQSDPPMNADRLR
jgi:hypothetical protein